MTRPRGFVHVVGMQNAITTMKRVMQCSIQHLALTVGVGPSTIQSWLKPTKEYPVHVSGRQVLAIRAQRSSIQKFVVAYTKEFQEQPNIKMYAC